MPEISEFMRVSWCVQKIKKAILHNEHVPGEVTKLRTFKAADLESYLWKCFGICKV